MTDPVLNPAAVHPALSPLIGAMARAGVRRVMLYGSRARGDNQVLSDIDLAVDWPGASSQDRLYIRDLVDNARTLLDIDCVFLDSVQGGFRDNILKEGKILYDSGHGRSPV
ncbi:MAG: nucleotidyltransferase domain-containing protein [Pseudomonadota bacterium]|nr:nucleotidyltransferase domain-containing protein [Pseudomonadota bacterium]